MEEKNFTGLIPENIKGRQLTAEACAGFSNSTEAHNFYETVRQRLLLVHNWQKITGTLSADFQVTDKNGNVMNKAAEKGDYFRIDITGPGSEAGDGYDWAYVEEIKEIKKPNLESIGMRVRPAPNPKDSNNNTAHFFSKYSTSTFVVTRENNKITASVYDRNIEANEETKEPLDKIRNSVVGLAAKHGISKLQWQALTDAFVKRE
jgi:hypothetical protein